MYHFDTFEVRPHWLSTGVSFEKIPFEVDKKCKVAYLTFPYAWMLFPEVTEVSRLEMAGGAREEGNFPLRPTLKSRKERVAISISSLPTASQEHRVSLRLPEKSEQASDPVERH